MKPGRTARTRRDGEQLSFGLRRLRCQLTYIQHAACMPSTALSCILLHPAIPGEGPPSRGRIEIGPRLRPQPSAPLMLLGTRIVVVQSLHRRGGLSLD